MTLDRSSLDALSARLRPVTDRIGLRAPGVAGDRQPVHTVYGGADLFTSDTASKMGRLALASLDRYAPDAAAFGRLLGLDDGAGALRDKVVSKLGREPVEDYRLDFEDGYGIRSDAEEDGHARSTALEVAAGMEAGTLPPFVGIRVKPLTTDLHRRALVTLDLFVTALVDEAGRLPEGFVVTLPKVQDPEQVAVLAEALAILERRLDLARGSIPVEVMVETTETVIGPEGLAGVRRFVDAGGGRVIGAHFGTYDYTASCSITAEHQSMDHPVCDFARHVLQVSLAGSGVRLSDGATNVLPVPLHRGDGLTAEEETANREAVHAAWRLHFGHVRRSLYHGYYQGWDLHPAQLVTRYAAVYSFFLDGLERAGTRLRNFLDHAAKATLVGDVFDDAATGQGLLNYFLRAVNCGAITAEEAGEITGLTQDEVRTRSFAGILEGRRT